MGKSESEAARVNGESCVLAWAGRTRMWVQIPPSDVIVIHSGAAVDADINSRTRVRFLAWIT